MKKALFFAMTAMLLSACVAEQETPVTSGVETITFEAEASTRTRTSLVNGTNVFWCAGDEISVMGAAAPFTNSLAEGETASKTAFTGEVETADAYYAVYPASAVTGWNGTAATVKAAMRQNAVKGSFANGVNITAANTTSQEKSFAFKNVLGYVKMTIPAGIKTIIVTANGGEKLYGEIKVDCNADDPAAVAASGSNCVTLSAAEALEAGDYYIALIPGAYSKGLSFDFVGTDGRVAVKSIDAAIELAAGHVNSIGTVSGLEWTDPAAEAENAIWKGKFVSGSWDNGMTDLANGKFDWSAAKPGDVLKVHGGATDPATVPTMSLKNKSWSAVAGMEQYYYNPSAVMSVTLTEEMIADLADGGLIIQGDHYYCTCIELVPGAEDPGQGENVKTVTLWEGSTSLGTDWSTAVQIQGPAKIPYGAKLHVEYETPEGVGDGYYQIKFCYINAEWSWVQMESHLAQANEYGCVMLAAGSDHYSVDLLDSDVDGINNGKGLVVQGYAATITKVYYTIGGEDASSETVIWEGEFNNTEWKGLQDLAWGGYNWSSVTAGQKLTVYGTPVDAAADWWCISLRVGTDWVNLEGVPTQYDNPKEFTEVELSQETIDHLVSANGLVITGTGYIITKVTLE